MIVEKGSLTINKKAIQIFGIRRSGNHAVISWILEHHQGILVHLNDVKNFHPDPYQSFSQIHVKGIPYWRCRPRIPSYVNHRFRGDDFYRFGRWAPGLNIDYIKNVHPKKCLIISHEDYSTEDDFLEQLSKKYDKYLGQTDQYFKVVLMRDAFNQFASLIKAGFIDEDTIDHYIELYKKYSKIVIKEISGTHYNTHKSARSFIFINYNKWFYDNLYRQNLARELGFQTSGEAYKKIPVQGGGSTFNGIELDGKAENLKVLERWKDLVNHPLYQKVLSDDELRQYSDHLFGKILKLNQLDPRIKI
jgi:hypothetical protein